MRAQLLKKFREEQMKRKEQANNLVKMSKEMRIFLKILTKNQLLF